MKYADICKSILGLFRMEKCDFFSSTWKNSVVFNMYLYCRLPFGFCRYLTVGLTEKNWLCSQMDPIIINIKSEVNIHMIFRWKSIHHNHRMERTFSLIREKGDGIRNFIYFRFFF